MLDPIFRLEVWPHLSDQQRRLHLTLVERYRAEGAKAFHIAPNVTDGVVFRLQDGSRLSLSAEDLKLELTRLGQDGLIEYRCTGNVYLVRPTPDGIALAEAILKSKEPMDLLAIPKNGAVQRALSTIAARRGSAPDQQLIGDAYLEYVGASYRDSFPFPEFERRIKERLNQESPISISRGPEIEEIPRQAIPPGKTSQGHLTAQAATHDTPELAERARIRGLWLDQKIGGHPTWSSDNDIAQSGGPAYNTIQRYRSGALSTRDPHVRKQLAKAFKCEIKDVPK